MKNLSMLHDALNYNILNLDSVHDILMATKYERIKEKHPYAITPPNTPKGRWQTCYRDASGKRINIKAPTEQLLLDKLFPVYFHNGYLDKLKFCDLYEEWLVYKTSVTSSPNTIIRHKQHYKKYFQDSILHDMKVSLIEELTLEKECNRIVKEHNLSRKEWCNVKTILNGMFTYAFRKKYIDKNPLDNVHILVRYRQVVKKSGRTETYNTEELLSLNTYLDKMYEETQDCSFLAVKLNFLLGLRIGELVALKHSDYIAHSQQIHIVREEVRNQQNSQLEVVEHTKTNRDRYVIVIPKALEIIKKIPKQGEYLFMRDGKRITARQISYVLEKYAQRQGVATKSTHKMRKTYASMLNTAGVPLDCIREQLGHSSLSTTLGYIYNPLTEQETYELISSAL